MYICTACLGTTAVLYIVYTICIVIASTVYHIVALMIITKDVYKHFNGEGILTIMHNWMLVARE